MEHLVWRTFALFPLRHVSGTGLTSDNLDSVWRLFAALHLCILAASESKLGSERISASMAFCASALALRLAMICDEIKSNIRLFNAVHIPNCFRDAYQWCTYSASCSPSLFRVESFFRKI